MDEENVRMRVCVDVHARVEWPRVRLRVHVLLAVRGRMRSAQVYAVTKSVSSAVGRPVDRREGGGHLSCVRGCSLGGRCVRGDAQCSGRLWSVDAGWAV